MINRNMLYKIYNVIFFAILGLILIHGIYYHFYLYVFNAQNSFVIDECCLVINALLPWQDLFIKLPHCQCTPPVFSIITKLLLNSMPEINESVFRFFLLFVTILSMLSFTFLETKIIKNKFAILAGIILFIINRNINEFSCFYKHYCFDILMSIIIFTYAIYIKDKKFSSKELFILGVISCICTLFSYTSAIVIAGIFIAKILYEISQNNKINIKGCLIYLSPIFVYTILFIIFVLIPLKQDGFMDYFWFSKEFDHIILSTEYYDVKIWGDTINFIMSGFFGLKYNLYIFFLLILISLLIFYKQNKFLFYFYMAEFPIMLVLSLLKIYPFGPSRVILYAIPLFYILILKAFDIVDINKSKIKKFILLLIVFVLFSLLNNYKDLYSSFQGYINQPRYDEGSASKYYYELLKHSDVKSNDYVYWCMPPEIKLYNKENLLKLHNPEKQIIGHKYILEDENDVIDIPKNNNIFIYLSNEYYFDYKEEYDFMQNFIKNDCKVQYSILDNIGTYTGYFIKCTKTTDAKI